MRKHVYMGVLVVLAAAWMAVPAAAAPPAKLDQSCIDKGRGLESRASYASEQTFTPRFGQITGWEVRLIGLTDRYQGQLTARLIDNLVGDPPDSVIGTVGGIVLAEVTRGVEFNLHSVGWIRFDLPTPVAVTGPLARGRFAIQLELPLDTKYKNGTALGWVLCGPDTSGRSYSGGRGSNGWSARMGYCLANGGCKGAPGGPVGNQPLLRTMYLDVGDFQFRTFGR